MELSSGGVYTRPDTVASAAEAKELLVQGNRRFVSGQPANKDFGVSKRRELASKGQQPFSVVVGCSDSRVPLELLFDQALGDLFVVRVAGNVVDQMVLGSVDYAVKYLHVPLVVVLGHENCGAVKAVVDGEEAHGSIGSIFKKLEPSVAKAKAAGFTGNDLYEASTDENIRAMVEELKRSPVIKCLVDSGGLSVLGGKFHLQSGQVRFFPE